MYRVPSAQRVIAYNSEGTYDTAHVKAPFVLKESSSSYKMWYEGVDGSGISRILYATSTDGVTWSSHALAVDYDEEGTYDTDGVRDPWVVKETSSSYKMWYIGEDTNGYTRVMYATSTNGTSWTAHALAVDGYGDEEFEFLSEPCVVRYASNSYAMWITHKEDSVSDRGICRITSTDGTTWTFVPPVCIDVGEEGTNDTDGVGGVCDQYDSTNYKFRYDGEDSSGVKRILGVDEGTDTCPSGEDISVYVDVSTEGTYDTDHAASPSVVDTSGDEQCWYAGYDGTHWNILYGEATEETYIRGNFVLGVDVDVLSEGGSYVDLECNFLLHNEVEVAKELSIDAAFVLTSDVEVQGGDNLSADFVLNTWVELSTPYNTIEASFVLAPEVTTASVKKAEVSTAFVLDCTLDVESPLPIFATSPQFVLHTRVAGDQIYGNDITAAFVLGGEVTGFSASQDKTIDAEFVLHSEITVGTDGSACSLPAYDSTRWA